MRFSSSISAAFALASFALRVNAHGYVLQVSVDGKNYQGSNGPSASGDSPIRKVSSNNPVTDPTSNDIICGLDAQQAPATASANPGSTLQFSWGTISGGNWFHNIGPIMTYMAKCSGDCSSFSPDSSTEWFKIDEQGEEGGTWAQAKLVDGSPATVKIPDGLASGNYLVRHELISLQNSVSQGGTEYYPSCLQVTVGGNDSGEPDTTVNFPGAYSETDPGILGDFYTPGYTYVFPGGAVATISGSGSSSGGSDSESSSAPASSSTPASSTRTSTPSAPSTSASSATSTPAATTSLPGVVNPGSSPSSTTTSAAANPTVTGKCRSSKKRQLRRRSAASNGTAADIPSRRSLKMHKRRAPHAASF